MQIEECSFAAGYETMFELGYSMKAGVLGLWLLRYAGKRNVESTYYCDLKVGLHVVVVYVDGDMMVLDTLKMETCFVRCFGGEVGLTDDVEFAAFVLKHNFQEK